MPIQCPICSRINPEDAAYCYYDGRSLIQGAQEGPLQFGVLPFPMPFCFPDGHSCTNFNQLALACDERWNEARTILVDGIWKSFFSTMGRLDLATVATQAAKETDSDFGLTQLLEKLPADALRPPKLAVLSAEEDLGALEPGKDHKFELHIVNQGMLVLRGSVTTDCDWLFFGECLGGPSLRLFQTRHTCTLRVRVLGDKLRAGRKPIEGQIVVESNGGSLTVPVRATVPIRPFPGGEHANNVLAGVMSPHELALKAKAQPNEAAVLFEQGAVKAWYASNGWIYPIQGSEGKGKGAVQQFFEALGLTKPPRLEISTGRILCKGKVGQELTKHVTISTPESRFVYADARSNQDWIKPGPGESKGNSVTIPLHIEVPPCPGTTVHADVTVQGNGKQQFVVVVALAIGQESGIRSQESVLSTEYSVLSTQYSEGREEIRPAGLASKAQTLLQRLPKPWIWAGVGMLLLIVVGVAALATGRRGEETPPIIVNKDAPPPPKKETWWDGIPDTKLATSVAQLKAGALAGQEIFDNISLPSDVERYKAYELLAAKLPELMNNPKAKGPLGRLVTECCIYDPSELALAPLRRALVNQFPGYGVAFRPEEKGAELERAFFALQLDFDAITNKAIQPDRLRSMANDLGRVFGDALDITARPEELKVRTGKLLAERCYRNTLATAAISLEHALAIRALLVKKVPQHLLPGFREKVDLELIDIGLSQGNEKLARLEPILKTYLARNDLAHRLMHKLGPYRLQMDQLTELMTRPDAEIRTTAKEFMETLKNDLAYLARRLSHDQPEQRQLARRDLVHFAERWRKQELPALTRSDLPALITVLKSGDGDLAAFAVEGMVQLGPETAEVVPQLVKFAQGKPEPKTLAAMLRVLSGTKVVTDEVLTLFENSLDHADVRVWTSASQALVQAGRSPLAFHVKRLSHDQPEVRQLARQGLLRTAELYRKRALPPLAKSDIPSLSAVLDTSTEPELLTIAADGLIQLLGSDIAEAVPPLVNFAQKKPDAKILASVLCALAGMKTQNDEVLTLFENNLDHPDVSVCMKLSLPLLRQAPDRLNGRQPALVARCQNGLKQTGATRILCIDVLAGLKEAGADALPQLLPLLNPADEEIALHVVRAIKAMKCAQKALPALVQFAQMSRTASPAVLEATALVCKADRTNAFFTKGKGLDLLIDALRPDATDLANCLARPLENPSAQALLDLGAPAVGPLIERALKNTSPASHRFMAYTLLAEFARNARGNDDLIRALKAYEFPLTNSVVAHEEALVKQARNAGSPPETVELYSRTHEAAVQARTAIAALPPPGKKKGEK